MNQNYFLKISKFLLCLVPFTVVIVYPNSLFPFIVGKYVFFRTTVFLALAFFLWAWARGELENEVLRTKYKNAKQHEKPSKKEILQETFAPLANPLVIGIAIFVGLFLLAGFLGYNPSASFWSNFERGEGGLQLLCVFIFFGLLALTFRDEKSWKKLFIISLSAAFIMFLYGLGGALNFGGFIGSSLCERFAGSLGNAAYVGTYMLFVLFYGSYLFLKDATNSKASKWFKWLWLGAIIFFFVILLLSQTRGALLGLAGAVLFGLIYLFRVTKTSRMKRLVAAIFIFLLVGGSLAVYYRNKIDIMPFCTQTSGGNRIIDISLNAETYQTRLILWQIAVKAFKDRPILGWGPENFAPAFESHYDTRLPAWFDRAHNIFFDYLVDGGILGFLAFLFIFIAYYHRFLKYSRINYETNEGDLFWGFHKETWMKILIFILPIAYLIQGMVLFDVLPTYINLFLSLAFMNFIFNSKLIHHHHEKQ